MENLFIIGWGLGGGFGGIRDYEVIQAGSIEEAEEWAFENACENYDRYVGSNGLREIGDIMEEEEVDEEEACDIFAEERENWMEYYAVPYTKEYEDKVSGNHYNNPYKEITDL